MKKLIWITLIVVLLGGCAWLFLFYLASQVPPAPKMHSMALADLDAFLANGRNEAAHGVSISGMTAAANSSGVNPSPCRTGRGMLLVSGASRRPI